MEYHVAQLNISRILYPLDHSAMADFVNNLERINSLAEASDGYCWRLKGDNNNATTIRIFGDESIIVNMSVWKSIDHLFQFAYRTAHTEVSKRRNEWFERLGEMHLVLWYVPAGHQPTVAEAEERLTYLRRNGESPYAFTFKKRYGPGGFILRG